MPGLRDPIPRNIGKASAVRNTAIPGCGPSLLFASADTKPNCAQARMPVLPMAGPRGLEIQEAAPMAQKWAPAKTRIKNDVQGIWPPPFYS